MNETANSGSPASPPDNGSAPGFESLGLTPEILDAVRRVGYTRPTEIQRLAIPPALEGKDILGTAHTGTGKTAAFTLPMVQRMADHVDHTHPRGLVITPTRELAQQVAAAVHRYGATSSMEAVIVHGGTSIRGEIDELDFGCDVLVATPGRLLDHIKRGSVDLSFIEVLILDEADRMLDMGFIDDVKEIVDACPRERQTMLFSATMPNGVMWLATEMMRDPVRVAVGMESAAEGIRQVVKPVDWAKKHALLLHLLEERTQGQVLVFTRRRDTATYLTDYLKARDLSVDSLHGGMAQNQRDKSLTRFREGKTRILVATNVAARGLDITGIKHVINFDVPEDPRDYVHRVGRTARGDETGDAVTLVAPGDWLLVSQIEALTGEPIERREIEGFEPSISPPPREESAEAAAETAERRSSLRRGIRRKR